MYEHFMKMKIILILMPVCLGGPGMHLIVFLL